MRVEIFSIARPYFSFNWQLDPADMAIKLANWFRENPNIDVKEIKHDVVASSWYPPQLVVTIYFIERTEMS
jgi:hypothetical protein